MLEIGKANEVKFKVSVNGTAAAPTVRVVIETPNAELGFKAEKSLDGGDEWFSEVFVPEELPPGSYNFRVEAVINNRLFTPIKRKVEVAHSPVMMAAEEDVAATPTQTPKQTHDWEAEGGSLKRGEEIPNPLPPEPSEQPKKIVPPLPEPKTFVPKPKAEPKPLQKQVGSLMKEAVKSTEKTPTAPLSKRAYAKPVIESAEPKVVKPAKMDSGIVPPKGAKEGQIRIKMNDIMAESEARFGDVLAESPSYRKPGKAVVTPLNIEPTIPVTLIKGDVIYE
jgi:hypothetical protein